MSFLRNYLTTRHVKLKGVPTMEHAEADHLAESYLLELDAMVALMEERYQKGFAVEHAIESDADPEEQFIATRIKAIQDRIISHGVVIGLYHIIERLLKAQLASLDSNVYAENKTFDALISQLQMHPQGFDVKDISNFTVINSLRKVANSAKHDIEICKDIEKLHQSFTFRERLPDLAEFTYDNDLFSECCAFIMEVFRRSNDLSGFAPPYSVKG